MSHHDERIKSRQGGLRADSFVKLDFHAARICGVRLDFKRFSGDSLVFHAARQFQSQAAPSVRILHDLP